MKPKSPAVRSSSSRAVAPSPEVQLPLRITLVRPPTGVRFCLQGKDAADLVGAVTATGDDASFELTVRVRPGVGTDPPRFLGPLTHGPPDKRFVYVCSGTSAGQWDSCWTRRAKVGLTSITPAMIDQVRRGRAAGLEARIQGTARDGGPACATVPLLDGGWTPFQHG